MNIISQSKVECVDRRRALLGESPVWNEEEASLYWVDIEGYTFNRFDPSKSETTFTNTTERISALAIRDKGGFAVATENGFKLFNNEKNELTSIVDPEKDKPDNRFNDGRCDRAGRFWSGTMVEGGNLSAEASLYCLDHNLICKKKYDNLTLANGLAWSPDDQTMYLADTRYPVVWVFDFDIDSGRIFNQRIFLEFGPEDGVPDGATVDTDSCYWLATPRSSKICRYTSAGELDTVIKLPVTKPTMCAFGGPNFNTLYITTSSYGLSESELATQPLAGCLLAVEVTAQGLPEAKFLG